MSYEVVKRGGARRLKKLLGELEAEFERMKWHKNADRKGVSDTPCYSMALGTVFRPFHGVKPSRFNEQYPELLALLQELADVLDFSCTTFTINKNLQCKPHRDRNNNGESLIVALGDFKGGLLTVEDQDFDIHHRVLRFNGAKATHATTPFLGTRYSIVLYNIAAATKPKKP